MKIFVCALLFAAAAWAQEPLSPVPPAPPAPPAPQVYQFHNGPFGGSTSYLGVNLAEIDAERAKELKLKGDYGVEITRVENGSPADKAGLKPGDVVLEYNGQRVEGMEQFGRMVRETPAGREVKLLVSREGATQKLTATIGEHKGRPIQGFPNIEIPQFRMPDIPQIFTTLRSPVLGVEVETMGDQLGDYFGVKEGVLVRAVLRGTPADKAGIRAGDVITKVDGTAVASPGELSGAVRNATTKKSYSVDLTRDHKPLTLSVMVDDRSERTAPRGRVVFNEFTN